MSSKKSADLLPGTLDLLVLRTLVREPMHGYGIAERVKDLSHDVRIVVCDRRHGGKSRQVLRAYRTQSDIQPVYYVFDRAALSY